MNAIGHLPHQMLDLTTARLERAHSWRPGRAPPEVLLQVWGGDADDATGLKHAECLLEERGTRLGANDAWLGKHCFEAQLARPPSAVRFSHSETNRRAIGKMCSNMCLLADTKVCPHRERGSHTPAGPSGWPIALPTSRGRTHDS